MIFLTTFVSPKAKVDHVFFEGSICILGESVIGEGSLIGDGCIIGYPVRSSVKKLINEGKASLTLYDSISSGSILGRNCIVRSGTIIYESVKVGDRLETGHNVLIREKTIIGNHVRIGTGSILDGDVIVKDNVNIQSSVYIPPKCIIGSDVFIGPRVCFTNDKYPPSSRLQGVIVENGAVLGANSTLISGIIIGENSVVAAGAVVTRDVPPNVVVAGVPARIICNVSDYLEKRRIWESS
ncbi:MAG: N-acetyltransferase [archaeon GB-1867-097]|nr:N-acetyltransferase [Candidatus Culexmicrobium thermophilum]